MRREYRHVLAKRRRSQETSPDFWGSLGVLCLSTLAIYAVLFPKLSGSWGSALSKLLVNGFGICRFFVPCLGLYASLKSLLVKPWNRRSLNIILLSLMVLNACLFFSLFGNLVWGVNLGGTAGYVIQKILTRMFGLGGTWILALFCFCILALLLLRKSPVVVIVQLLKRLEGDLQEWKENRKLSHAVSPPVVRPNYGITTGARGQGLGASNDNGVKTGARDLGLGASNDNGVKTGARDLGLGASSDNGVTAGARGLGLGASNGNGLTVVGNGFKPFPTTEPAKVKSVGMPDYTLPGVDLFSASKKESGSQDEAELSRKAAQLEKTLNNFNITAKVIEIHPGPVITRYDLEPGSGVKLSSIVSLSNDIALSLRGGSVRMVAPIPGKGAVGVEIPNEKREIVCLSDIISSNEFQAMNGPLTFALGKTASGQPYVADISEMPHLLIAGATGSGKSVCVHSLIVSLLYKAAPDQVKFMLIDPKRLELTGYNGIPHIYDPRTRPEQAQVITRPRDAAQALDRLVKIMEYRYEEFAKANVRNIEGYNQRMKSLGEPTEFYLVVIIDEFADLMLTVPKNVEDSVQRLAQMARAVGIHLVLATQRPSVDIITGVIKANLPSRIAFRVSSQTDSRVILDCNGAETLLGQGDMLFLPTGAAAPVRIQGAFVSETEVEKVMSYIRTQGRPYYKDIFGEVERKDGQAKNADNLSMLLEALRLIVERRRVSQDLLKARFGSSAKATDILSLLEIKGFINKPEGTNRWEIYFDRVEEFLKTEDKSQKTEVRI